MDILQKKLRRMESLNPSLACEKSLLTRFKEYCGAKNLRADVQSRVVASCLRRDRPFLDYIDGGVSEREVTAEVARLNNGEKDNFRGRFKFSFWKERPPVGHPIIFDGQSPFDENTKFNYKSSSWNSRGEHYNFKPDPLDDISLLVRNLKPGLLMMQNVSNELFTGHLVGLYSPDKEVYGKTKVDLLEFGFEECFKNIYR